MAGAIESWVHVAAAGRWLLYSAVLLAVGSGLFMLLVAPSPVAARVGRRAALAAAGLFILATGLSGTAMVGAFTAEAWRFGLQSSAGTSAIIGVPAMLVLAVGCRRTNGAALAVGCGVGIGSFLVTGHAATAPPAAVMTPAVALHLLCAAFWLGALAPLFAAAGDPDASGLYRRFSKIALGAVALLIASGIAISAVQVESFTALGTAYGRLLIAKVLMVTALIALAAVNRLILTPRLAASAGSMRRSIAVEFVLFGLVLAAAASLTAVPPPRAI